MNPCSPVRRWNRGLKLALVCAALACAAPACTDRERAAAGADGQRDAVADGQPDAVADGQRDAVADGQRDPVADGQRDAVADGQRDAVADGQRDPVADGQRDAASDPPSDVSPALVDRPQPTPDLAIPLVDNPLGLRIENRTCALPELPALAPFDVVEAFPALDFESPLWFGHAGDDSNLVYVAVRGGSIFVFEDRDNVLPADRSEFLRVATAAGGEMGLLGLAFHPQYALNRRLYVYYSVINAAGQHRSRISEFQRFEADARRADPASERVILEVDQPFANHNGGDIDFGPDGYLYIALGDGGSAGDPRNNGQRPSTLLGSILRLDVDRRDGGLAYGIPVDNPFVSCTPDCGENGAARAEVYAFGLRNPWRMSFDSATGRLFAGDVGQNLWEEIDIIERGGNYGWRLREGLHCYNAAECRSEGLIDPIHEYGHDVGLSITGGHVYRGPDLPELWGAYVYADYSTGRIWALRYDGERVTENRELRDTRLNITSFGLDRQDRLYLVAFNAGLSLWRLVRRADLPAPAPVPQRLSETGCFEDTAAYIPAAGVIDYDVNVPFHSDGAEKRRHFALPRFEVFEPTADQRTWGVPVGTVFIKTFSTTTPEGRPFRIETRLIVKHATGFQGFTYRWNRAQDDALLLPGALNEAIETNDGVLDWPYPSRAQCESCHTEAAGSVLGVRTPQLNYPHPDAPSWNFIDALVDAGYALPLAPNPGAPQAPLPRFPRPDDADADVSSRARAVIDVNCAFCHRPGANGSTSLDLRADTPLSMTGTCDVPPTQGPLDLLDARLIAPGAPENSVVLARMGQRGLEQMPPLGTRRLDEVGLDLVRRFIQGLAGCD